VERELVKGVVVFNTKNKGDFNGKEEKRKARIPSGVRKPQVVFAIQLKEQLNGE
jgi:hypothetical protein